MANIKVVGTDKVLRNLAKANKQLTRALSAGIIDSTTFIERESNKIAPKDSGFMREQSSFTTDVNKKGSILIGRVGYDAMYAPFVHEMPESNNFTTSGSGPKFLEKTIKRRNEILKVFFNTAKRFLRKWQ